MIRCMLKGDDRSGKTSLARALKYVPLPSDDFALDGSMGNLRAINYKGSIFEQSKYRIG